MIGVAVLGGFVLDLLFGDPAWLPHPVVYMGRAISALERRLREDTDAVVFSGPAQSGVLSFLLPGEDCEETARRLAEQGIAVRAGLHCAPLAHESAGTFETGTVRVSFSVFNTMTEVEVFVNAVKNMRGDRI